MTAPDSRPVSGVPCPSCDEVFTTERGAAQHLRRDHDDAGRWGGTLLADGGRVEDRDLRDHLLEAAEAEDDGHHERAEAALLEALGMVRKRKGARTDGGEDDA